MTQSIFCVGNLAKQEFIVNGEPKNFISGSAAFAALSAKTTSEEVLLISSIGRDFSQAWLNLIVEKGVKLKLKVVEDKPSIFFKYLNEELIGKNISFHVKNLPFLLKDALNEAQPNLVYIAPNSFKIQKTLLKYAKSTKAMIALGVHEFDLKNMKSPKKILNLINHVNLLFLNDSEAKLITEAYSFFEAIEVLKLYSINKVIAVTMGRMGVLLIYNGETIHVPAFVINEVDSIGAGDSFAGAFSAKYLICKNVIDACKYGCLISSLIVGDFGLNALLNLTQNKVERLIKEKEFIV
ncbi:MAG: PfkB family carbohydrate kinase [Candidatus Bathyarchaeia archaeon]